MNLIKQLMKYWDSNIGIILPGFTHTRKAMPLPLQSWLGSFKNAMKDNLISLDANLEIVDNNPLGSAAGFGGSCNTN